MVNRYEEGNKKAICILVCQIMSLFEAIYRTVTHVALQRNFVLVLVNVITIKINFMLQCTRNFFSVSCRETICECWFNFCLLLDFSFEK